MTATLDDDELAGLLARELRGPIGGLTRLSAGASRETWAFTADREPLILQRSRVTDRLTPPVDEPALLRAARAGGVSVPEIVVSSSTGDHPLGAVFTITRRLTGESIPRRILRDEEFAQARTRFVQDCARELAAIHALDAAAVPGLVEVGDPVAAQRDTYEAFDDPHPVFDLAFRWLDRNRPKQRRSGVVHGDFRMGNLLVDDEGVVAVLDWELAQLGDPVSDLGWLVARAWRFGGPGEVGGVGTREELVSAYRAAGGVDVTADELRWWEVLASVRWGVITMLMGTTPARSLEQTAIGRRVVETEYDVMLLLRAEAEGSS